MLTSPATSGHVLKKTVLELGGSDPFIVLEDADLDEAAQVADTASFQNNGQSCISAKRFIVVDAVAEAFEQKFVANTAKLKVGDPLEYDTRIGPVARKDLPQTLDQAGAAIDPARCQGLNWGQARRGERLLLRANHPDRCHSTDVCLRPELKHLAPLPLLFVLVIQGMPLSSQTTLSLA